MTFLCGGRGTLVQGNAPAPSSLSETMDQYMTYLEQRLANG